MADWTSGNNDGESFGFLVNLAFHIFFFFFFYHTSYNALNILNHTFAAFQARCLGFVAKA
jgi:hypothetical protein